MNKGATFLFFISMLAVNPSVAQTSIPADPPTVGADKPARMLLLDLKATLIEEEVANIVTNMVSSELNRFKNLALITNTDVKQMLALEAEKQTLGCADDSSCLAEIAGAMGARYVVYGDVGKLGSNIVITLNVFDSVKAESSGRATSTVKGLDALPEKVPSLVREVVAQFAKVQKNAVAQTAAPKTPPKAQKVAAAEPTPKPAPDQTEQGTPFPWLRVGLSLGLAAVGGAAAALYGWPAYDTMVTAQKAYAPVRDEDTQEAADLYDAAQLAQSTYMGGPVFAMFGGGLLALAGGAYGLYVTGEAVSEGE